VRFSGGDGGRAVHALADLGELIESGRFSSLSRRASNSSRSRRRTASARTGMCAGSSCCWSADVARRERSPSGSPARPRVCHFTRS
jgi:hypothetical protein